MALTLKVPYSVEDEARLAVAGLRGGDSASVGAGAAQSDHAHTVSTAPVGDRDAQPIRYHRSAEVVVVSRVYSPATDGTGNRPAAAACPRGRVTVRRRAVLHRDRTTGSIAVNNALAAQIASELDSNDR